MKWLRETAIVGLGFMALDSSRADESSYVLRITAAKRVRAVNTFEITYPRFVADEWYLFAPSAPGLPGQTEVSTVLEPGGKPRRESSERHRTILSSRLKATDGELRKGITYTVEYRATLMARELVKAEAGSARTRVAALTEVEREQSLASSATFFDFDAKAFQDWLEASDLRRRDGEGDIDLARRVFLFVKRNFAYEARLGSDPRASAVCRAGRSDCGGLSTLLVSALRANGVAARTLMGKWATSMEPGAKIGDIPNSMQHVKAEFFAAGVGWVPADTASAVLHDKSAAGLEYFGRDTGDFLVFQVDYDLGIETEAYGKVMVPWLWFSCWPRGTGTLEGPRQREDWQVEVLPE